MNMNKKVFGIVILLLVFCFSTFAQASVDSTYEVAVVNFKGDVNVDPESNGDWIKPWIGMKLEKDAVIKTGKDSFIEVVFDSEGLNVLKVKAESLITLREARVDLSNGSVMAAFANLKGGSTFAVKTPAAVCGIRGSGMGVDHINNMTVVSAYEHSVYVQGVDEAGNPVGKEVIIPEGWKVRVLDNGNTTAPDELTENEKKIFEVWADFITGDDGDDDDDDNKDNKDLEEIKKGNDEEPEISDSGSNEYSDPPKMLIGSYIRE